MKRSLSILVLTLFCVTSVVNALASPFGGKSELPPLHISVTQLDTSNIEVVYRWRRSRSQVVFDRLPQNYRSANWKIKSPGFELITRDGGDAIKRKNGKPFKKLTMRASVGKLRLAKTYEPLKTFGRDGLLFYTGHFVPVDVDGNRVEARFDVAAKDGGVFAFSDFKTSLKNWESPTRHSSYIYIGPVVPTDYGSFAALIDPNTPDWIALELDDLMPQVFAALETSFGFPLDVKPNLFLSVSPSADAVTGRLSYSGDALPGQFQINLDGGAWATQSDLAEEIFVHSTVHEAVHLWQASTRPASENVPDWLHEGAADAIAAETMVSLGIWDANAFHADKTKAHRECAEELSQGSLNGASLRGDFRALYACGHLIADAISRAENASTASYWREFIYVARDTGYTQAMFFDLAEQRTGNAEFARSLRRFARTPFADPAREIRALLVQADSVARSTGEATSP